MDNYLKIKFGKIVFRLWYIILVKIFKIFKEFSEGIGRRLLINFFNWVRNLGYFLLLKWGGES